MMSVFREMPDRPALVKGGGSRLNRRLVGLFLVALLFLFFPPSALAEAWTPLVNRLAADGFSEIWVTGLFTDPEVQVDTSVMGRKMRTLYSRKFGTALVRGIQKRLHILGYDPGRSDGRNGTKTRRAIKWFQKAHGLSVNGKPSRELLQMAIEEHKKAPTDIRIPPERPRIVYETIMTPERLGEASEFYAAHKPLLLRLERAYGVPPEIAVGVLTVETRVGKYLGEKSAFVTLASMAVCSDLDRIAPYFEDEKLTTKKRRWLDKRILKKSDWAYKECKALLTYALANNTDPLTLPGSFYGALGISQFMPTTILNYGADGNGDGVVDVFVLEDALFSMGNYLRAHGWKGAMKDRRRRCRVIYRYNHSKRYVNTVLAVADYLRDEVK